MRQQYWRIYGFDAVIGDRQYRDRQILLLVIGDRWSAPKFLIGASLTKSLISIRPSLGLYLLKSQKSWCNFRHHSLLWHTYQDKNITKTAFFHLKNTSRVQTLFIQRMQPKKKAQNKNRKIIQVKMNWMFSVFKNVHWAHHTFWYSVPLFRCIVAEGSVPNFILGDLRTV